jgi:histone H3/H4
MNNTAENLPESAAGEQEVVVVVSKLKNYIRSKSGMNTASNVAEKLSELVRGLCDQAIEKAKSDGRKTVMDRDF